MRLCSGWQVWLMILMMARLQKATNGPRVVSCWKNWLKMNDNNYLKALERYENCGRLVNSLTNELSGKYLKSLVDNLQKSSNYFFDHTDMTPAEVIRVLRSANSLMEAWSETGEASVEGQWRGATTPCAEEEISTEPPCDETEEDDGCADGLKWFRRAKVMFYCYVALIVFQALILTLLFINICCTDLLTSFPSCHYETQCCCEEDKEWITKLIEDCENQVKDQPETYPLLLENPARKVKAVGYGTNFGKRRKKDDEILTDLTPLSSPRLGSDSEFEALMNRRPLKPMMKPRLSTVKLAE